MKRKFIWLFFATVAVLATSSLALATEWPTASGNYQRTGFNPTAVLNEARLTQAWSYLHPTHGGPVWGELAVYNQKVFVPFNSFTAAVCELQALDVNTGGLLWTNALTVTGTGLRGTPSAATIGGTDYVYIGRGSAGGAAGVRCINATTGLTVFDASSAGQRIRYSRPVLVDTNADATLDIVVAGTEGGNLIAWNALTGVMAWTTTLDAGYWVIFGPSVSTDGMVIYCGTIDLLGAGHGRVHAVDSDNGAILGTFDPLINGIYEDEGYSAAPIYVDDNTVIACGNGSITQAAAGGRYSILDRFCNLLGQGSVNNGSAWATASVFPDPLTTDTLCIVPMDLPFTRFGAGLTIRARNVPTMRGGGSGFRYNLYACTDDDYLTQNPIAIGNSPGGEGLGVFNTDGGLAGSDAKMYVFPPHSFTGTTNFHFWQKTYYASQGFFNVTGPGVIEEASNPAGVVLVTPEGYGFVHGFNHSSVARARWQDESFCSHEILLNVPLPFNGTDTDTATFYNVGDGPGSYTVSGLPLAAALEGKTVTNIQVRSASYNPRLGARAEKLVDEVTVTGKQAFMRKDLSSGLKMQMMDEFPAAIDKSSFSSKQRETATAAATPAWLTITDLTGGGPVAAGGFADIELVASSAALGLGTYTATLVLTVAPDEPDPDFYGGTDLLLPITFIVGFIPSAGFCDASDAALEITNWGTIAPSEAGFLWDGAPSSNMFGGGLGLITQDAVLTGMYNYYRGLIIQDADLYSDVILAPSPYVSEVHVCSTAYIAQSAACSLRVRQFNVGLWDGAFCDSMIVQKHVIQNTGSTVCSLSVVTFIDWDLVAGTDNLGDADPTHGILWQYNDGDSTRIFGIMRKPTDDRKPFGVLIDNPTSIYDATNGDGSRPDDDSLLLWASTPAGTFDLSMNALGPDDKSMLIGTGGIVLNPGETHVEEYIFFGWDVTDVPFDKWVWKTWLRQNGFYRGDVNTDNRGQERDINNVVLGPAPNGGKIDIVDIVYLANYYLKGTANPWPFDDQGDVNMNGAVDLADVIGLANFVFKGTNIPTDYNRFGPGSRTSLYLNPDWQ